MTACSPKKKRREMKENESNSCVFMHHATRPVLLLGTTWEGSDRGRCVGKLCGDMCPPVMTQSSTHSPLALQLPCQCHDRNIKYHKGMIDLVWHNLETERFKTAAIYFEHWLRTRMLLGVPTKHQKKVFEKDFDTNTIWKISILTVH